METQQYTREELESWKTGRLGWLYMKLFKNKWNSGKPFQLDLVTSVLFERSDVKEKLITKCQIEHQLEYAIRRGNDKDKALYSQMLWGYQMHVMG